MRKKINPLNFIILAISALSILMLTACKAKHPSKARYKQSYQTQFLGTSAEGERFAFVLDYSASQTAEQLAVQQQSLLKSLDELEDGAEVSIIFFSGPAFLCGQDPNKVKEDWIGSSSIEKGWHPREALPKANWLKLTKAMREKLRQQILATALSHGTEWYYPIKMALELEPKPDLIFFMTDGLVPNPQKPIDMPKADSGKTKINAISFGIPDVKGQDHLKTIANITNGQFKAFSLTEINETFSKSPK